MPHQTPDMPPGADIVLLTKLIAALIHQHTPFKRPLREDKSANGLRFWLKIVAISIDGVSPRQHRQYAQILALGTSRGDVVGLYLSLTENLPATSWKALALCPTRLPSPVLTEALAQAGHEFRQKMCVEWQLSEDQVQVSYEPLHEALYEKVLADGMTSGASPTTWYVVGVTAVSNSAHAAA